MEKITLNHIMVDVETTGLNPQTAAIIQIGAAKFDPRVGGDVTDTFSICLKRLGSRRWEDGTARFWQGHAEVLNNIEAQAISPQDALQLFASWAGDRPVFWAKPAHFDFPFVESHLQECGIKSPFNFRKVIDAQSFCRGLLGMRLDWRKYQESIPSVGTAHDALDDVKHQVAVVIAAIEGRGLPPSLRVTPNIPHEEQTLDELKAERAYWDEKVKSAPGPASAVAADEFRTICDSFIRRKSA